MSGENPVVAGIRTVISRLGEGHALAMLDVILRFGWGNDRDFPFW